MLFKISGIYKVYTQKARYKLFYINMGKYKILKICIDIVKEKESEF